MQLKTVIALLCCAVPVLARELRRGDPNTCLKVVVEAKTIMVPQRCGKENKNCSPKKRRMKVTKEEYVCCDGWIFRNDVCVRKSTCEQPCVNSLCTADNECTCNAGLQRINDTLCAQPCPPDQHNDLSDPTFPCIPNCSQPCVNGRCVGEDECSCDTGYTPKDRFTCEYKCSTCGHGICEAPDYECQCHTGYRKTDGKCEPVCEDCKHGTCIEPDRCHCHSGYQIVDRKCKPICDEPCQDGVCTSPNECTCNENYTKDVTNNFKCNPICENTCVNSTCIAPGRCDCYEGYESAGNDWTCRPSCKACENGVCVNPGECVCNEGYEKKTNASDICSPVCSSCVNGDCVEPKVCQCHDGYDLVNGTCLLAPLINCKVCDGACKDGVCACPNGSLCHLIESADVESTPTLAGLQLTWMLGGAVGILLVVVATAVIIRMWRQRQSYDQKAPENYDAYGSVVYTVPNTLVNQDHEYPDFEDENLKHTDVGLLEHIPTEDCVERI